jgi:plastocyanin
MNKTILALIIGLIAVVGIAGVILINRPSDSPKTQQAQQQTHSTSNETPGPTEEAVDDNTVEIKNFAFSPQEISVKKGSTVTWTNADTTQHDVTPDNESDAFQGSELLGHRQTYEWTFSTPGTYTYHCGPHPNMTATIVVTE